MDTYASRLHDVNTLRDKNEIVRTANILMQRERPSAHTPVYEARAIIQEALVAEWHWGEGEHRRSKTTIPERARGVSFLFCLAGVECFLFSSSFFPYLSFDKERARIAARGGEERGGSTRRRGGWVSIDEIPEQGNNRGKKRVGSGSVWEDAGPPITPSAIAELVIVIMFAEV